MPTKSEIALVRTLVNLAMDISNHGKFCANVEIRSAAVEFRISDKKCVGNDWLFYGEDTAYFSSGPWTEADFASRIGVFIEEAKKYKKLGGAK